MSRRQDDTITIAHAYELFPDEWVLMHITRPHNDYRKEAGRVLAHSNDRDDLIEPHRRFRAEHPDALLGEFFAGDVVPEGVTVIL
jgi:hypothetical protein